MTSSRERLVKAVKQFVEVRYKVFGDRYGQNIIDILDFPIKVVLSPFTLAFDIAGSAPRGFGVPELISKLSATSVFVSPFSPFLLFFFSLTFRSISLLFFCYSISLSNFWVFEEMEIKGHFLDAASFAYLDSENVFVFVIKMSFFFFTIPPSIAVKLFMLSALEFEYWVCNCLYFERECYCSQWSYCRSSSRNFSCGGWRIHVVLNKTKKIFHYPAFISFYTENKENKFCGFGLFCFCFFFFQFSGIFLKTV